MSSRKFENKTCYLTETNNFNKFWEGLSYDEAFQDSWIFLWKIFFKKYVTFARTYLGKLNKEKLPLLDKFLAPLEFLHQTMLSFKVIRFCSMFGSNHKMVFRKLIGRRVWLIPVWKSEALLKMVFITDVFLTLSYSEKRNKEKKQTHQEVGILFPRKLVLCKVVIT